MEEKITKIRRPMVKDADAAIRAYFAEYMGNQDIMKIFGCSESTASRIKKAVRRAEIERHQQTVVPYRVKAEIAFELLDIDVEKLIKSRQRLAKLGLS